MISRRGLFGLLAGVAAAPVMAPLAKIVPEPETYTTYLLSDETLVHLDLGIQKRMYEYYTRVFVWKHEPGILWWSKEKT